MKPLTQILLLLLLCLSVGCRKEFSERADAFGDGGAAVQINAAIADRANATKAIITDPEFPDKSTYGIFVCKHGGYEKHKLNSWNLSAVYNLKKEDQTGTWSYYYVSDQKKGGLSDYGYDFITITASQDNATADLYAYAPHTTEAFLNGPTAIPFTIMERSIDQTDLMYALENAEPDQNKGLDPKGDDPLVANFTFQHALSQLVFTFKLINDNTLYKLNNIVVKKAKDNTTAKLLKSGTFNAIDGSFAGEDVDSLSVRFTTETNPAPIIINSKDNRAVARMLIPPTAVEDDDLVVKFYMNDKPQVVRSFVLKKEYLKHGDGSQYGFQGGYTYTFHFTMDNYLYLNGIDIDDTWMEADPENQLKEIEI